MYQERTRSIEISVEPFYIDEQSVPEEHRFVFGYRIKITNGGAEAVRLVARRWQITDANGQTIEVAGPGVVGQQPVLEPGQEFEYASGTPLPTPSGFMAGSYEMVSSSGERFEVQIPPFSLDAPGALARLH